ncbi:protein Skeletor, isoforms B/C isoform X2 [Cephus cinctus]|uniref:Protein Skeletor, isoforms B/C isoform X2 n=1 Tax=Cephus cinctus TaxID=211228 RepID=A0AAJ7BY58_CEPCN|nr:protein Skeletor, isoforms B/C isoform X2 [Cephus cinctus]
MKATNLLVLSCLILCTFVVPHFGHPRNRPDYYGKLIGNLRVYAHGIKGTVYAVDENTIFIKGFCYDGTGPDAYFWVGSTTQPTPDGFIVPYPDNGTTQQPAVLRDYDHKDIILKLPLGKRIRDIKWLSIWCRRFTVNFGDVYIPSDLEVPKAKTLSEFSRLAHGLRSENITILDSKTFYIPNLHYDGAGPDAYFWVGTGPEPTSLGTKVPNEMGSLEPLRGYQGEDIEIVLPDNLTVYDIQWLAVWCVQYRHNFGHVLIPKDLDVPPALGQTKITTTTSMPIKPKSTNCKELLDGRVQVQWIYMGDDVEITLSGRITENEYIAFGLSGREGKAEMVDGDVVVVGYDRATRSFFAEDYYMSDVAQCDGKRGVCPDERVGGKNDATLIHGERNNGITKVTYTRPMRTNELEKDKIIPDTDTSIIAAIGPLNSRREANAHNKMDVTTEDIRIDFTSTNDHSCKNSLYDLPKIYDIDAWPPAKLNDDTFSARIGPTGGKRGYERITGSPSWGIAWYINDLLIPELTVTRGQTYTFIVEGGNSPTNPARYHPLYITDSPEGGYAQKSEAERTKHKVYAGVEFDKEGQPYPTAAGRYCEWTHKTIDMSADSKTFESFFETLRLECEQGEPAKLVWTVQEDTPDLVYYQCYTHNNLGWKIHVVDPGQNSPMNGLGQRVTVTPLSIFIFTLVTSLLLR